MFEVVGSAYFLAFPTIFVLVQVLAPYLQHPVLQTALLVWVPQDLFPSRTDKESHSNSFMAVAGRPFSVEERRLLPDLGIECLDAAWGILALISCGVRWVELLQSQESDVTRPTTILRLFGHGWMMLDVLLTPLRL
eukprot:s992_g14.t1